MSTSTADKAPDFSRKSPPRVRYPLLGARVHPDLMARIDAWAAKHGLTRSEAVRVLIQEALVRV